MPIGRFLAGIGALVWHPPTQTYLLLRRGGQRDFQAGQWECVTGRVDQGEGFAVAFARELREEIGEAAAAAQFEFLIGATHFYRGAAMPETELLGLLACFSLADRDAVHVSEEHSEYRWLTAAEATALLPENHWLVGVIAQAEVVLALAPPDLRAHWRRRGVEIF